MEALEEEGGEHQSYLDTLLGNNKLSLPNSVPSI